MSETDTGTETGDESAGAFEHRDATAGYVSRARRAVREGKGVSAATGIGSGLSLLSGVRALRRGDRDRAFGRFAVGGVLAAIALDMRRSADEYGEATVDQTDVVSTAPDIGDLGGDAADGDHRTGDDAQQILTSSVDLEDVASSSASADETATEPEVPEAEMPEAESYERLGAAAFDEHSGELPVPQAAFNRNVLSLNAEAFWGIREDDDAVVLAGRFDPIRDRDGIRYVASTEIDDERMVSIPDAVLNHWDDVAGGGLAVASGDEITFVTAESLEADGQIRLVPEQWLDEVLEDGE